MGRKTRAQKDQQMALSAWSKHSVEILPRSLNELAIQGKVTKAVRLFVDSTFDKRMMPLLPLLRDLVILRLTRMRRFCERVTYLHELLLGGAEHRVVVVDEAKAEEESAQALA